MKKKKEFFVGEKIEIAKGDGLGVRGSVIGFSAMGGGWPQVRLEKEINILSYKGPRDTSTPILPPWCLKSREPKK